MPATDRLVIKQERDASLALLHKFISRRAFIEISLDLETVVDLARSLSERHTERLGCRGFDLVHVALAIELKSEAFLTSDRIQGALARAEGLDVTVSGDE
jgi:predicted nucleic acid-binding protein